jgi:hypothetical protein
MQSKNLVVLFAPHTQQVSILDVSPLSLSCAKGAREGRTSGARSRMYPGLVIAAMIAVALLLLGLCVVVLDRQSVIAACVVDRAIVVGDGIEFASFPGALNQSFEQTSVAGQEVVRG